MDNERRTGIQISQEPKKADISIVSGGIKISASQIPIKTSFVVDWGKIYILLDCSGSMKRGKLEQAKIGIRDFVRDAIKKQYYIGLIKFGDKAQHLCEPTNSIETLQKMTASIRAGGSTNLTDAIKLAYLRLKDFTGLKVMVIATDGMPDNVKTSLVSANNAKASGIEIITIGTDDADLDFLKMLASATELGKKVSNETWAQAIYETSRLLPGPKSIIPK